ncbi:MAG: HAD family phosphatase [Planctomycetes bacterium]|nr:HAD family phosphatase [Planctomycetota bacterium]
MPRIRLVALDIDGTILDSAKRLSPRTLEAIRGLRGLGLEVTLISGRTHPATADVALALSLDGPLVSLNGSLIRPREGPVLYAHPIPAERVRRALDAARELPLDPFLFLDEEILVPEDRMAKSSILDAWTCGKGYRPVPRLEPDGEPVYQVHFGAPPEEGDRLKAAIERALGEIFDVFGYVAFSSRSYHIELRMPGDDKGTGLAELRRRLGLQKDEVLAVGDWLNDVPLLREAGVAVAMKGSPGAVIEAADHLTPGTSDEEGLAAFLEDYFCL